MNQELNRQIHKAQKENDMWLKQHELTKNKLIQKLKGSLGEEIKNNPNKITIIKEKWYKKFIKNILKLF